MRVVKKIPFTIIKRAGTDSGTSSIIKSGQKDTKAGILIALSGFFNGKKTVSRFRPLKDINIFEFSFGIYVEILESHFLGLTEIFAPPF